MKRPGEGRWGRTMAAVTAFGISFGILSLADTELLNDRYKLRVKIGEVVDDPEIIDPKPPEAAPKEPEEDQYAQYLKDSNSAPGIFSNVGGIGDDVEEDFADIDEFYGEDHVYDEEETWKLGPAVRLMGDYCYQLAHDLGISLFDVISRDIFGDGDNFVIKTCEDLDPEINETMDIYMQIDLVKEELAQGAMDEELESLFMEFIFLNQNLIDEEGEIAEGYSLMEYVRDEQDPRMKQHYIDMLHSLIREIVFDLADSEWGALDLVIAYNFYIERSFLRNPSEMVQNWPDGREFMYRARTQEFAALQAQEEGTLDPDLDVETEFLLLRGYTSALSGNKF